MLFQKVRLAVPLITPAGVLQDVAVKRLTTSDAVRLASLPSGPDDRLAAVFGLIETITDIPTGFAAKLDIVDLVTLSTTIEASMKAGVSRVGRGPKKRRA